MRIFKFLLTSLIVLTIAGGLVFLVVREALLMWAVSNIKTSLSVLRSVNDASRYASECRKLGTVDGSVISQLQLVFTSDTDYSLMVVCNQFLLNPVVIEQKKLPPFVKKRPGSAGIILGIDLSGMELEVWGRRRAIMVEGQSVFFESAREGQDFGVTPVSSCSGYGFRCCQTEVSTGVGAQYTGVNDCPRSCFQACTPRPVILSFTSDPFMDTESRVVTIQSGEVVSFSYVIDSPTKNVKSVTMEYGDGSEDSAQELLGSFDHVYTCNQSNCQYTAHLVVSDTNDQISADTPITQITIVVNQ